MPMCCFLNGRSFSSHQSNHGALTILILEIMMPSFLDPLRYSSSRGSPFDSRKISECLDLPVQLPVWKFEFSMAKVSEMSAWMYCSWLAFDGTTLVGREEIRPCLVGPSSSSVMIGRYYTILSDSLPLLTFDLFSFLRCWVWRSNRVPLDIYYYYSFAENDGCFFSTLPSPKSGSSADTCSG